MVASMRALRLSHHKKPSLVEVPTPEAGAGEARVRVHMAGVCSTDLHLARGYKGGFEGTLGHEFVGHVDQCPDAPEWLGRRVVAEINVGCQRCSRCEGAVGPNHCGSRQVVGILGRDGCFADWIVLPIGLLHAVPDDLPDRRAVFTEPVAAALRVMEQVHVRPGARVAVLGDGKLGQLITQALLSVTTPTLIGRHPAKLAIAEARGARVALGEEEWGTFELVVEATGTEAGLREALARVRPTGTIVLKSTFHGLTHLDTSRVVVSEVTLVGSRCGPFTPAIEALRSASIDPEPLIDAVFELEQGPQALQRAATPGVLKVLLTTGA